MLERYTAVDVETPNRNNDSIRSIGIVRMEYGTPVYRREFLVNPHEHFDDYNIKIHGITPEMVRNAPTFAEIWPGYAIRLHSHEGPPPPSQGRMRQPQAQ